MPVQGVSSAATSSTGTVSVSLGKVENVSVAAPNVEQSHTFPANTKSFMVQARSPGKLKMSFTSGTSGSNYYTIFPGAFYRQDEIDSASTTIYFQSPIAGLVVELVSWA